MECGVDKNKKEENMTRAEQLIGWARTELGSPYIFGAAGQKCTPAYRQQVMKNKPEYAEAIQKNCPVLSGKQAACAGCKYEGRKAYDCRGLTREGLRAMTGRPIMGAGATSQWNDASNWDVKGPIQAMPEKPCIVFVQKGSTMSHTGIYAGGGSVIHASGHNSGVIDSPMPRNWTHYANPVGLYKEGDIYMADEYLIRRRDKGEKVKALQEGLLKLGYALPRFSADGDFGAETEGAVKKFQQEHDLPIDAVWDNECQAALDAALAVNGLPPKPLAASLDRLIDLLMAHRASLDAVLEELNGARKLTA